MMLAERGHSVALVDISAASLEDARRRFITARLEHRLLATVLSDAADLVMPDTAFDAALLFGPLYHTLDDSTAARCVRRAAALVRPGGYLFGIFLTRTSVLRDLLKRGRFGEIRHLLADQYLDHRRYHPLSAESRSDYLPPVRTHRQAEAEALLEQAGLDIVETVSLESIAAWMRPYIDQTVATDAAFEGLSAVALATAALPELVESGDHFLIAARRPGTARVPPAGGPGSASRPAAGSRALENVEPHGQPARPAQVLVRLTDRVCFSPSITMHEGRRLLAVACGAMSDRTFVARQLDDGRFESWYVGGRNHICLAEHAGDEPRTRDHHHLQVPAPPDVDDMTGASLVSDGSDLHLWFSARPSAGSWCIYHTVSRDNGHRWSPPDLALMPGATGSTDGAHVLLPAVLRCETGWRMWYVGRDARHRRIHLAESADGITWIRRGVALDVGPAGSPDAYAADCPAVVRAPDGTLVMVYGAGSSRSLAAAVSDDGLAWRKVGPVRHRGAPGTLDAQYAFYPSLLLSAPNVAELCYSGEDDRSRWSVLHGGALDLLQLRQRPSPLAIEPAVDDYVRCIRTEVPKPFLHVSTDSNADGNAYLSADRRIRQLRPSSTPVFEVGPATPAGDLVVVKLGRGRAEVEREFDGLLALAPYLPVPKAALHYTGTEAALLLEHLNGVPMAGLASESPGTFAAALEDVASGLSGIMAATLCTAGSTERPGEHPLQTRDVLAAWREGVIGRLTPWSDLRVEVNGEEVASRLGDVLDESSRAAALNPGWLALGNGDPHLRNILVDPSSRKWFLLDAEFAGFHDVDYTVGRFLGSCLKHSGLLRDVELELSARAIRLALPPGSPEAQKIIQTPWLVSRFSNIPLNRARVRSFLVSDLYFRLMAGGPSGDPPPFGVAALALGFMMTGPDRP